MNKLYQPIRINKLELKNRIVMAPMSVGNTKDGFATERDVEFFRRRARGGAGLIVFANIQWDRVRYNPHDARCCLTRAMSPRSRRSRTRCTPRAARCSPSSCTPAATPSRPLT